MAKYTLTDKFCRDAVAPEVGQRLYFDDHKDAPTGFALRVTPGSRAWVMNYYRDGQQRRLTLPVGYPGWGPTRARTEASKIRDSINAGRDPLGERRAEREAARLQEEQSKKLRDHTLGNLLTIYIDALEASGKVSAERMRAQVERHVKDAHPKLWAAPAADIRPEDGVEILSTLVKAGTLREAGKLRATLRASYAYAVRARLDAGLPSALREFGIRANPFADLPTIEGGSGGTRDRALTESELRAYWARLKALSTTTGALLRLHLLTGGQRVEQLARATTADLDQDAKTLTLRDSKGRRKTARLHVVPLVPDAMKAIEEIVAPKRKGEFLLSIDGGRSPIDFSGIAYRVREIAAAMVEAGEASTPFTPGDLRRTVETRLAALGISEAIRAQLQSHGLGGVQARHYDRHSYEPEKRGALLALRELLEPKSKKVVQLKRKTAA